MKVLLINPPIREWSKPNVFPLGLGYLAAVLLEEGHDVSVMDINAYRWDKAEVEKRIQEIDYDVVGIGGIVTIYSYVKWLVSTLKQYHSSKKIVVGGSVGSSIPEIVMERTDVDVVCIGEGEETIKELVDAWSMDSDLSGVKGIWYRCEDGRVKKTEMRSTIKELDSIPLPAWDLFPMDIYLQNPVGAPNRNKWIDGGVDKSDNPLSMNLSATRGCPYKCIYCYHDFMGQGYRHRSAAHVLSEIKYLHHKYNVSYFHFVDDEFVMKADFVFEFCKLINAYSKDVGKKITWGCSGRVNLMTDDMISTMVDAGCVLIGYGIETGSQRMLDVIKKGVTVEQAKNAIRMTRKYLDWVDTSFMIGSPGETKETIQETINFCKELDLAPEVIFFTTPYPGTELYQIALQQGKIKDEEEYILGLGEQGEKIRINFTDYSDDDLYRIQSDMINELGAWNKIKHVESR